MESRGYLSVLSLTSALDGGEWLALRPGRFAPGKRHVTHCIVSWVVSRADLDGYE